MYLITLKLILCPPFCACQLYDKLLVVSGSIFFFLEIQAKTQLVRTELQGTTTIQGTGRYQACGGRGCWLDVCFTFLLFWHQ